jgi:sigma-B regulation protein RsbU (phosphoserine phosphatase)
MRALSSWPRPLLVGLAAVWAAATIVYSALWMGGVRVRPGAYLGVDVDPAGETLGLRAVAEGSPAQRAGLRAGDRILTLNGRPLTPWAPLVQPIAHGRPGDRLRVLVARPGAPRPLLLEAVMDDPPSTELSLSRRVAQELLGSYPVLFLAVAIPVLLLRVEDRNAWLLALLFAGFIAAAPLLELNVAPSLRGFALAYRIAFYGCWPAFFLYFFAVFPVSSPVDRRLPWLKTMWLAAGLTASVPLAAWALAAGSRGPLVAFAESLVVPARIPVTLYYFGGFGLGLVSLVGNATTGPLAARRKSRVILWGTLVGFLPAFVLSAVADYLHRDPYYDFPFWVWAPCVLILLLIPLSFAYAVVKDRVLEIPVLLRRSARYLLVQRGFVGLLVLAGAVATLYFALSFGRRLGPGAQPAGIAMGAGFGTALVLAGTRVQQRVRSRIDRAFFRGAYDARQILQDLADRARSATSREDLAALLGQHVMSALFPRSLDVFLESRDGALELVRSSHRPAGACETLPAGLPILGELARRARPWEVPPAPADGAASLGPLASLQPDCLVPILGRDARLTGLIVLGTRLSEDPYSREDKQLLASVASQTAIALDSIRLAEEMANRIETERRATHEMELARQVQSRLLPEQPPSLLTLECAARCVQARAVGGDYYDFLDLGPGRTGLVLADISGKGFPAALVMASLQASLRSRLAQDMLDLPRQLRYVNDLLYRTSESNRYATLFLGLYDDASRRLVYANCGHNPPILLRADGAVSRLAPTAPVLGLLEEWECAADELRIECGDLLALFSDGITEAFSDQGEEFGDDRLIDVLRTGRGLPAAALVDVVIRRVAEFSGSQQEDDMTLVVARSR